MEQVGWGTSNRRNRPVLNHLYYNSYLFPPYSLGLEAVRHNTMERVSPGFIGIDYKLNDWFLAPPLLFGRIWRACRHTAHSAVSVADCSVGLLTRSVPKTLGHNFD